LLTGIELIVVDAGIKIRYSLFAIAFYGGFVISPMVKMWNKMKTLKMNNSNSLYSLLEKGNLEIGR